MRGSIVSRRLGLTLCLMIGGVVACGDDDSDPGRDSGAIDAGRDAGRTDRDASSGADATVSDAASGDAAVDASEPEDASLQDASVSVDGGPVPCLTIIPGDGGPLPCLSPAIDFDSGT